MADGIAANWNDHVKSARNLTLVRLSSDNILVVGNRVDRAWAFDGAIYTAVNKLVLVDKDLFKLDERLPYFEFSHEDRRGRLRSARAILGMVNGHFHLTIDCKTQV